MMKNISKYLPLLLSILVFGSSGISVFEPDTFPCTELVKDINTNGDGIQTNSLYMGVPKYEDIHHWPSTKYTVEFKGWIYFSANSDGGQYSRLWKTNGSTTVPVQYPTFLYPKPLIGQDPHDFVVIGDILFFVAFTTSFGKELWKTDGTTYGTKMVKNIDEETGNSTYSGPRNLRSFNGSLLFFSDTSLWKSDGTAEGTIKVASNANQPLIRGESVILNGVFYFVDWLHGLLRSDGTAPGTSVVHPLTGVNYEHSLTVFNGKLFFIEPFAEPFPPGEVKGRIWTSDGTQTGTKVAVELKNIQCCNFETLTLIPVGNQMLMWMGHYNSDFSDFSYYSLWRTDGTQGGTWPIKIFPNLERVSFSYGVYKNKLYFSMPDAKYGSELWQSDGTSAGTKMLKNIYYTLDLGFGEYHDSGSYPRDFTIMNDRLYFTATELNYGRELWKTDGTTAGTFKAAEINPTGSSEPQRLIGLGNKLFFSATNGVSGRELFVYKMCSNGASPSNLTTPNGLATSGTSVLNVRLEQNPVQNTIMVSASGTELPVTFYLLDSQGQELEKRTLSASSAIEVQQFDVSRSYPGLIFLRVVSGKDSKTVKVVKVP